MFLSYFYVILCIVGMALYSRYEYIKESNKVTDMKKRSLGKQLLFAGSILTVAFACQSKASNSPSSKKCDTNQNSMQNDNEDEDTDDGAYGDGDTSTSNDQECTTPAIKVESVTDVTDIKQAEKLEEAPMVSVEEIKAEVTSVIVSEIKEDAPVGEVVLEAVSPVEIVAEQQVETQTESSATQN